MKRKGYAEMRRESISRSVQFSWRSSESRSSARIYYRNDCLHVMTMMMSSASGVNYTHHLDKRLKEDRQPNVSPLENAARIPLSF